jgi:hypothetical protein
VVEKTARASESSAVYNALARSKLLRESQELLQLLIISVRRTIPHAMGYEYELGRFVVFSVVALATDEIDRRVIVHWVSTDGRCR